MAEGVSVIIPAFNEETTLQQVAQRVLQQPHVRQLVIVDDCSSDQTGQIAAELATLEARVKVAHHSTNLGKTEALKTGLALTTEAIVLVQDADMEYDPAEIDRMVAPILSRQADIVYGSRFLARRSSRFLYFYHYLANRVLTSLSNLFTHLKLTDVATGYKAFRGDIIRNMTIASSGFGFEFEVTAKAAKLKCPIYEVPISYRGRTYSEGKKIGISDCFAALWYVLKFNLFCSLKDSYRIVPVVRADSSLPT